MELGSLLEWQSLCKWSLLPAPAHISDHQNYTSFAIQILHQEATVSCFAVFKSVHVLITQIYFSGTLLTKDRILKVMCLQSASSFFSLNVPSSPQEEQIQNQAHHCLLRRTVSSQSFLPEIRTLFLPHHSCPRIQRHPQFTLHL